MSNERMSSAEVIGEQVEPNPLTSEAKPNSTLVEDIATFIQHFIFLREDVLYDLAAVWVIGTYLTDLFDYVGYLFAYSPEKGSGKSRLLEVLGCLVKNSSGLLVSPTEAVLFRLASKTTLLLDEVDSWAYSDNLRSVLNAGFQRNTAVGRVQEVDNRREVEKLSVFGPKAFAGIGTNILSEPTRDRTFMFEMVRQRKSEKRDRFSTRRIEPVAKSLVERITRWTETNKSRVQEVYDQAESAVPYLSEFGDRTVDISLPLAAILEVAYTNNPKLETARARFKAAISLTRNEQQLCGQEHKLISQLVQICTIQNKDVLIYNPTEISQLFMQLFNDQPSPETISVVLRKYGFKPKSFRTNGGNPKKRYELRQDQLLEILERYAPELVPYAETLPEAVAAVGESVVPK